MVGCAVIRGMLVIDGTENLSLVLVTWTSDTKAEALTEGREHN